MDEKSEGIESFYYFFFIIAIYILNVLLKRGKKNKEEASPPPRPVQPPIRREAPPPPPPQVTVIRKEPTVAVPSVECKRKRRPRIARLVQGLNSKKELILLSEILSNKSNII